jgi:hypothetical protein
MDPISSARDVLLFTLAKGQSQLADVIADLTPDELHWEPLSPSERPTDIALPPERKKVWRVFQHGGVWTYDYSTQPLDPPPFTTIAWILNHIAQTADMYVYCIRSGQPEGVERAWDDLPVPGTLPEARAYLSASLENARAYLAAIPEKDAAAELNRLTPAPWGEMRPVYINLWDGVIGHLLHHAAQVAARKELIRYGY